MTVRKGVSSVRLIDLHAESTTMGRLERQALRVLLGGKHAASAEEAEEEHSEEEHSEEEDFSAQTRQLRIAAIFIIFAAGMIGGVPPLFSRVSFAHASMYVPTPVCDVA